MEKDDKSINMNIRFEIANRIKEIRKAKSITQEKMAELLGVSYNNYVRIENGRQNLTIYNLIKISKILSVTSDTIIHGIVEPSETIDFEKYLTFAKIFNSEQLKAMQDSINSILDLQEFKSE